MKNLYEAGVRVCLTGNPGKIGIVTGKQKPAGSYTLIQVEFGPTEKKYKPSHLLELAEKQEDHDQITLMIQNKYGTPKDLRKILIFNKINGELTNIFYSMEMGDTYFYSHQFKPVLKFIESHVGKMLVADEVGLGKTIEAIYIWKELQARQSARRMLIVCPAMLRDKWKNELRNRFGIRSTIVKAKDMYEELSEFIESNDPNTSFVHIASLEGIRTPKDYQMRQESGYRARLGNLIFESSALGEFPLYDFVIFDEAHYLRNQTTSSNLFATLIRDVTENMLFLTATPIQTSNENLYQLLKLIDPDQFYDFDTFLQQIDTNAPLLKLSNLLRRINISVEEFDAHIAELKSTLPPDQKKLFRYIQEHFLKDESLTILEDTNKKMELSHFIESNQILNRYMNRTRKRDVIENRVLRDASSYEVNYSEYEKDIYQRLSLAILRQAQAKTGIPMFILITRQRQMASSLPASLESWQNSGLMDDLQEFLWEDQGNLITDLEMKVVEQDFEGILPTFDLSSIDINRLREEDSKFNDLLSVIRDPKKQYQNEKIIVFAYFRKTLAYLRERLAEKNIQTFLIQGGMGEEKYEIIEKFKNYDKTCVLLSSEVGSEGIDLQFCRILINYDLPWNPMRVEQRIGRIDRLGQKAKRINIINFSNSQTIEDKILERLYERVEVFKQSIGDLEEIIGALQAKLLEIVFDPNLSDKERETQAEQTMQARLENKITAQNLEDNAVNLLGFSDYLINTINESKETKRWIDGSDLITFVEDFFKEYYTETRIEADPKHSLARNINLSLEAKTAFSNFILKEKPPSVTHLHNHAKNKLCIFDQKISHLRSKLPYSSEFIDTTHPLILWIKNIYQKEHQSFYPLSAIKVPSSSVSLLKEDAYVYAIQKWDFLGITKQSLLRYAVMSLNGKHRLNQLESEKVMNFASSDGKQINNIAYFVKDKSNIITRAEETQQLLNDGFGKYYQKLEIENKIFCDRQFDSAEKLFKRKAASYDERIENLKKSTDPKHLNLIKAVQGLKSKEKNIFDAKKLKIESLRLIDAQPTDLSSGLLIVDQGND